MSYNDDQLRQKQADPAQIVSPPPAPASLLQGLESRIALYKHYLSAPLSKEELSQALQHEQWEVRCAAIERLGTDDEQVLARLATNTIQPQLVGAQPRAPRKKTFRGMRLVAMVAVLVIVVGGLTAAGLSWWDNAFGSPDLYAAINQQQTIHGVTIEINRVYADEGRTIIAYNTFSSDSSKQYIPDDMDITGSVPQKTATMGATYGEKGIHYYMIQPPFLVPANVNTLTITINIGYVLVMQPGHGRLPSITGPWHFVFTVPFHHVNNMQIPDPLP